MATFSDLIQRCLVELRQEPGISVQQYSEDVIAAILQRQFNTFFDHYWWPLYTRRTNLTLNGIDGLVTEDITALIKRWDDIRFIWLNNEPKSLQIMSPSINYLSIQRPHYIFAPYDIAPGKIFRIVPVTTVGSIMVMHRVKPAPFLPNDEVRIDDDLLVLATCFNYLSDDEDSPSATKKFAEAAGKREAQLREAMNKGPIAFSHNASPFNDWMMSP